MAGPTTETKSTLSFKKLVGKAHTSNDTPFYSESIPSQISIDSGEILGESIPSDPQTAVNDGLVEYVELDLDPIAASNGLAYNIRFPSDYSGNLGTGVQGDLVRTHTQIVDQKNNRQDGIADPTHSGGYVYDLEDGTGTQIPEGAAENWQLDPVGTIIVSEQEITELQNNGGTVGAYIYIGDTLDETIGAIQGGNLSVEDSGSNTVSDVKTLDFANLLDVSGSGPSVTVDVNDDLSQYDNSTSDFTNASLFVDGFKTDFVDGTATTFYEVQNATSLNTLDTGPELTASTADVAQANEDIAFNGDGTKLFVLNAENIAVYNLSTPYDISSGSVSFANQYFNDTGSSGTPLVGSRGLTFNNDGTRLFIVEDESGNGTTQQVSQYDLGTAYDISNASLVSNGSADGTFDLNAASAFNSSGRVEALLFNDNGTKIYVPQSATGELKSFSLGSAFDVTTADGSTAISTLSTGDDIFGMAWNGDGTELFLNQFGVSNEYSLTSAYDISTASSTGNSFGPLGVTGIAFDDVGSKAFLTQQDNTNGDGTGNVQSFNVEGTGPRELTYDFTGMTVSDDTTEVSTTVTDLNLGTDLDVTDDGSGQVTVDSTLSSKTTDDLTEGSNLYFTDERAQDAVGNITSGANGISVNYDDGNDTLTIDGSGAASDVAEDGGTVVSQATTINFAKDLNVTDDGSNQATIDLDSQVDITGTDNDSFTIDADGSNPISLVNNGSGELQITDAPGSSNYLDLRVKDLVVEGSETILNTETVSVADNTIVLNSDVDTSTSPTEDGGVRVNRGSETDAGIIWNETEDYWEAGLFGSENEIFLVGVNTTDDVTEGTNNLYFTEDRVKNTLSAGGDITYTANTGSDGTPAEFSLDVSSLSASDLFGSKTSDDLPEGSSNLYFTDERAQDAVGTILSGQFTYTDNDAGSDEISINQGSGSGLNADQLDGFDESAFAKLADNETITGDYTFEGSTSIATSGSLDLGSNEITSVADPTSPQSAATKNYVDGEFEARDHKEPVRAASNGTNVDLAATAGSNVTLDGVTLADGDRVLLKDQTDLTENGIYVANTASDQTTWTRAADADEADEVNKGMKVFVLEGNVNGERSFVQLRNDPITPGTDDMEFGFATGLVVTEDNGTSTTVLGAGFDDVTFGPNLNPTDDGNKQFTLNVEQDLSEYDLTNITTNDVSEPSSPTPSDNRYFTEDRVKNMLTAGGDLNYSANTGNATQDAVFSIDVSGLTPNELFGSKDTDDLPEGGTNLYFTDERAQDAVGTITSGTNGISVTYDDGANTITVDGSGAAADVFDDGSSVVSQPSEINFGNGLTAVADGTGATVTSDLNMDTAAFSGDGIQKEFQIAHGLSQTPEAWTVHPTSDAASGISHTTADSTNITIVYDTAPPQSASNNITVNYLYEKQ